MFGLWRENLTMKSMEEVWKDIPGYEGYYQVSSLGRVKRLPRHKATDKRKTHNNIRNPRVADNGYLRVNLSKDNVTKWYSIHRLVAIIFIPNPNNLPIINHKDENKQNNRVENIEWCTYSYNNNYGTAIERQRKTRAANPNDKRIRKMVGEKNSKAICQYSLNGELIAIYKSLTEASAITGVHITTIVRQCKGRAGNTNRTLRTFRFEYAV